MLLFLAPLLGALSPAPDSNRLCEVSFLDAGRPGSFILQVDNAYTPLMMQLWLYELGRFKATVVLDPAKRALPGTLDSVFFNIRFTRKPRFPLTLRAYADGTLRWQKTIHVAYWSPGPGDVGPAPFAGHMDYVGRADDGLPVPMPGELRIILTDAQGRDVGSEHYALPGNAPNAATVGALAELEQRYRDHKCFAPSPPAD